MTLLAAFVVLVSLFASVNFSAAASTVRVEAESMSLKSGAGAVNNDSNASGGRFLMIWANGTATSTVTLPAASSTLTLRVRGDQYLGAPRMQVSVDGKLVLDTTVPQTSWTSISANVSLGVGSHQLAIAFVNDLAKSGVGDRNLLVDFAEFAVTGQSQSTRRHRQRRPRSRQRRPRRRPVRCR